MGFSIWVNANLLILSRCEKDCTDAYKAEKRRCDIVYGGSDNPMHEKCLNEAEYDRQACNVINCACLCGGCWFNMFVFTE